MEYTITKQDIDKAKDITIKFDSQKTYDKFRCSNNYIGVLGEMVLEQHLNEYHIKHEWLEFTKKQTNQPDFIIGGVTIDLKTTYSDCMWFQEPKYDIYIYSHLIGPNKDILSFEGWITKKGLCHAVDKGIARRIIRNGRIDYAISPQDMYPMAILALVYR